VHQDLVARHGGEAGRVGAARRVVPARGARQLVHRQRAQAGSRAQAGQQGGGLSAGHHPQVERGVIGGAVDEVGGVPQWPGGGVGDHRGHREIQARNRP